MKLVNKLSLRYLQSNKRNVIVIIINIILSSMLLFTIALIASSLRNYNINKSIEDVGDYHLMLKDFDIDIYDELKENKDILDIILVQKDNLVIDNSSYNLVSFNKDIDKYIILDSGNIPEKVLEILVPSNSNYNIGDKLSNYIVVGKYSSVKSGISEYMGSFINIKDINYNEHVDYFMKFNDSIYMYSKFYKLADSLNIEYTLTKNNSRIYEKITFNDLLLQSMGQYEKISSYIYMYSIFIIVLIVISLFSIMIIKNSFEISFSRRKQYFAILRSIGTSRNMIIKMILYEIFYLSLISIPIGLLFSYLISSTLMSSINKLMIEVNTISYHTTIYPEYMIITIIFIIITIIYSAIKPIININNISIIESIKGNKSYKITKYKEDYPLIRKIFKVKGEYAYKTIKRNGIKFNIIVNSLIVSMLLFITLSGFINFIYQNNKIDLVNDYDISIGYVNNISEDKILNEIKNINNIDYINIYKSINLNFNVDNKVLTNTAINYYQDYNYKTINLVGLEETNYNALLKNIGLKESTPIVYNYDTYYENDNLKKELWFNKNIQKIDICNYQDNIVSNCYYTFNNIYLIDDTYNYIDNDLLTIVIPLSEYNEFMKVFKLYGNNLLYEIADRMNIKINTNDFIEIDSNINNIFNKYSDLEYTYQNYKLDNYEEYLTSKRIELIINYIMIFIIIISVVSIINTISANLLSREKEFLVLRSIGLEKKGINKILFIESIFIFLKAIIYGILSSTFFVLLLELLSYKMSSKLFKFPILSYGISFGGILIIVIIINLYSYLRLKDKNIIDGVRRMFI